MLKRDRERTSAKMEGADSREMRLGVGCRAEKGTLLRSAHTHCRQTDLMATFVPSIGRDLYLFLQTCMWG